jgi:hypothetical protein
MFYHYHSVDITQPASANDIQLEAGGVYIVNSSEGSCALQLPQHPADNDWVMVGGDGIFSPNEGDNKPVTVHGGPAGFMIYGVGFGLDADFGSHQSIVLDTQPGRYLKFVFCAAQGDWFCHRT